MSERDLTLRSLMIEFWDAMIAEEVPLATMTAVQNRLLYGHREGVNARIDVDLDSAMKGGPSGRVVREPIPECVCGRPRHHPGPCAPMRTRYVCGRHGWASNFTPCLHCAGRL